MNKKEAEKKAEILRNKVGKGWKIRVWENLGWHYEIHKGCISLYGAGGYSCLISSDPKFSGTGDSAWTSMGYSNNNPKKVILHEIKQVKKHFKKIKKVNEVVVEIEKELTKGGK